MLYDSTHKEYKLGMGLWFKLIYGHADNLEGWLCLSNIPELNYRKLESIEQADAVYEVMGSLEFETEYTDDIVQASVRRHHPRVEFENGSPVWTPETIAFYKPNLSINVRSL